MHINIVNIGSLALQVLNHAKSPANNLNATTMPHNRIAVFGHRGWASSAIVDALSATGAPVTVLHRAGSDTHNLRAGVKKIQVDIDDHEALIAALQHIDIVM